MSLAYRLKSDTNVIQKKSAKKKTKNHHFDNGFSFNKKIDHGFLGTTTTKLNLLNSRKDTISTFFSLLLFYVMHLLHFLLNINHLLKRYCEDIPVVMVKGMRKRAKNVPPKVEH